MEKNNKITFSATIEQHSGIDAAFIKFPFDVEKHFGSKGQIKVKALFDENVLYRGSLVKMGYDCHLLGITKEIRKRLNKSFGDSIQVEIEKDEDIREVIVPVDVSILLNKDSKAKAFYEKLSYTDKKEYIRWIDSAKKEETRLARIERFLNNMKAGIKRA
jgi:hypothetical protein